MLENQEEIRKYIESCHLWESDDSVLTIEAQYTSPLTESYKVIIFSKKRNELEFVTVAFYNRVDKVYSFIEKLNAKPSNRFITLEEKNENHDRTDL